MGEQRVKVTRRVLAAASAASVLSLVGLIVPLSTVGARATGPVTFSAKPATAALVTHYVVTAPDRSRLNSVAVNAAASGQLPSQDPTAAVATKSGGLKISRSVASDASGNRGGAGGGVTAGTTAIGASTPAPSATFIGQQSSQDTCSYFGKGCNPPDMAVAASKDFVLQGVNTQWEVWDSAGHPIGAPVSAQAFFGVPNVTNADGDPCDTKHLSQPFLSDPRAAYDLVDGRFWAAMLQIENGFGIAPDCPFLSVYYVAVSSTSDPSGDWNVYEFEMSLGKTFAGQLVGADYTQLGFDGQAVYFTANMFTQDGTRYAWAELFEANKAQMESGLAGFTAAGFYNLQASGPATAKAGPTVVDTVQPAMNLDGSANGAETFVDTFQGPDPVTGNQCGETGHHDPCSGLALWSLTNPIAHDNPNGGPLPALAGSYVGTQLYLIMPPADQPSCDRCIDSNDLRIPGTPVVKSGLVYAAWGTAVDNGAMSVPGIEWAQIPLSGAAIQQGLYTIPSTAVTYPTLMPDNQGNVFMLFEDMSRSVLPETRYISKAVGDANFSGSGVVLQPGVSSYRPQLCGTIIPVCRWGDYEAASFDGGGRIWFAGEYANHYDGIIAPVWGRNWGTWIGAVG